MHRFCTVFYRFCTAFVLRFCPLSPLGDIISHYFEKKPEFSPPTLPVSLFSFPFSQQFKLCSNLQPAACDNPASANKFRSRKERLFVCIQESCAFRFTCSHRLYLPGIAERIEKSRLRARIFAAGEGCCRLKVIFIPLRSSDETMYHKLLMRNCVRLLLLPPLAWGQHSSRGRTLSLKHCFHSSSTAVFHCSVECSDWLLCVNLSCMA